MDEQTAAGQWAAVTFGNGISTDYAYVASTRRLDTIRTSSSSGTNDIQHLDYTFDPLGNEPPRESWRLRVVSQATLADS